MFHTYVKASSGAKIDIDRARYLMDDVLFKRAYLTMLRETFPNGLEPFDIGIHERVRGVEYNAQQTWLKYCVLHKKKYGEAFIPDVDPTWDQ